MSEDKIAGMDEEIEYTPEEKESLEAQANEEKELAEMKALESKTPPSTPASEVEAPKEEVYTPNFKFKVLDQEKEFDEWIRPAVNKDNEKAIRELYEKAYGIDHIKAQREQERQARTKTEGQYNQLMTEIQELGQIRQKDLGMFFQRLGIPKQQIAQWVLQQAEAMEATEKLPENLKGLYNQFEDLNSKNYELQKQLEALNSRQQVEALNAKRAELDSTLASPSIKPLADEYDTRVGKPGSFQLMVMRHGAAEWEMGRQLNAQQATDEVIQLLGLKAAPPSQASAPTAQAPKVIASPKPTVLPNVGSGTGASTAKAPVSSLKELRELAKQALGG